MAFEQALQHAQLLGGDSHSFRQAIDCCTGFTARWIKYQLLGQDFWANPPAPAPPIMVESYVRFTFQDQSQVRTTKSAATPDGDAKIKGIYGRIDQNSADRKKAGKGTLEYLAGSKKLGDNFDALGLKQVEGKFPDVSLAALIATPSYVGAFHLSLQVDFDMSSGMNPLFNSGGISFHSVAAHRPSADQVRFFDPNMGEVTVPRDRFAEWFQSYQGSWGGDKMYGKFNHWVLTYIRGVDGLSAMGRDARARLKRRLRSRQEYTLSNTTKRPPVVTPAAAAAAMPATAAARTAPLGAPPMAPPPPPPPALSPEDAAALAALDAQLAQLAVLSAELAGI